MHNFAQQKESVQTNILGFIALTRRLRLFHSAVIDTAHMHIMRSRSMKRSSVRPSVRHSAAAAACGGFAAESTSRRYQSTAAGVQQQRAESC